MLEEVGGHSVVLGWAVGPDWEPLSVQDYLLKIIDTPGLLKPEQVSALFGNIESIYALNRYVCEWARHALVLPVRSILEPVLWTSLVSWTMTWAQGLLSEGGKDGSVSCLPGGGQQLGPYVPGPMSFCHLWG